MSKATEDSLSTLHGKLADVLKEALTAKYYDKDGNMLPTAPAAILNVARQFLKDNNIDSTAPKGSPLGSLAELPVFDESDGLPPHLMN